jgi:hypothetical protein
MLRFARAGGVLLVGALMGCGGGGSITLSDSGPPPPHGGRLLMLPGGRGFVEIVTKESTASKSDSGEVAFYFLKDNNTPMSPAPTAGTLTVGKTKVELKPSGDALVTPDGPPLFAKGAVDGTLSVQLDGKPTNVPLGLR